MRGLTYSLLSLSFVMVLSSCRASFEDYQKQTLETSGEALGSKDDDAKSSVKDAVPFLENKKELSAEESATYKCDGLVVVTEKGQDLNGDGVLRPTEVSEISTECKTATKTAEDPKATGKEPSKPNCPNQNTSATQCPEQAAQNNANQSKLK